MLTPTFGIKQKDLTPLQESVLSLLYLSERLSNYPPEEDTRFYASGRFFLLLNGVIFESYHRKLMRELELLGWIKIIKPNGILYYALTDDGFNHKCQQDYDARKCALHKGTL